jgi:hypothetical protein
MPKFVDYHSDKEVSDIMEKFLGKFPGMFEGFDVAKIGFVTTLKKKSKEPVKLHRVKYPFDVWMSKVYIVEVFQTYWKRMDVKKRNMAVFRTMCAIPDAAFDEQSKQYGKVLTPEIRMFMKEYAACGGVPNWMENPAAADPMERTTEDIAKDIPEVEAILESADGRIPVTQDAIEGVDTGRKGKASAAKPKAK